MIKFRVTPYRIVTLCSYISAYQIARKLVVVFHKEGPTIDTHAAIAMSRTEIKIDLAPLLNACFHSTCTSIILILPVIITVQIRIGTNAGVWFRNP